MYVLRNTQTCINVHRHVHSANNQQFVTVTEASRKTCITQLGTLSGHQLTELLHITNEKPITARDENLNLVLQGSSTASSMSSSRTPSFVGQSRELNLIHEAGMLNHITGVEAAAIFRAIKLNTTTNLNGNIAAQNKPIVWQPPIHACKAMITHFTL
jgi:hypothetical protein